MSFYPKRLSVGCNKDITKKIYELKSKYPEVFSSASHVVRCVIIKLWKEKGCDKE